MSHPDLGAGEWNAVKLGPETVGWAGPYLDGRWQPKASITILMGGRELPLSTETFLALSWPVPDERLDEREDVAFVQNMLCYGRRFAVPVPAGSLDSKDSEISYTDRSIATLGTVLYKFFTAFVAEIQSDLNTCNPIEVVRKFAELFHYDFPDTVYEELTWRGRKLDDIVEGTTIQAKAVRVGPFARYPYLQLPGTMMFSSFVEWQTRTVFDFDRILPENVFLIKASSPEEYDLVKQWFEMPDALEKHLARTRPEEKDADASFFLCRTGDVLEDWVDGEVLSVREFSRDMARVGAPKRKTHKALR